MKYKSCNLIQHGLCFFNNMLVSCCFAPCDQINGQHPPILFDNYKGEILSKDDLFLRIKKYSDIFKNGGVPKECQGCYHIEEKEWDEENYINSITITHFSKCNLDCIYCTNNLSQKERTNDIYDILPVLNRFKEEGIIKKGCEFHIGGGEFTIYKECDELIDLYANSGFAKFYVPTNAVKYSEKLFQAMDKCLAHIIVSLDSGSRKTYKKIKRSDAFNQVTQNLKLYAKTQNSAGCISLKYIIIPSFNDNYSEFKKFLKIAKNLKVNIIIIDIDAKYSRYLNNNIDEYLIRFARKLKLLSDKQGFSTILYSFYTQCSNGKELSNNIFKNIIGYIKYKFFNKAVKRLYKK